MLFYCMPWCSWNPSTWHNLRFDLQFTVLWFLNIIDLFLKHRLATCGASNIVGIPWVLTNKSKWWEITGIATSQHLEDHLHPIVIFAVDKHFYKNTIQSPLTQGSPTSWLWPTTRPWLIQNWAPWVPSWSAQHAQVVNWRAHSPVSLLPQPGRQAAKIGGPIHEWNSIGFSIL